MTEIKSNCIFTNRCLQVVLLTLLFQSSNFVFDWKSFRFHDHLGINYSKVHAGDNRHYFGIARSLLSGEGYRAPFAEMSAREGEPTYLRTPGLPLLYAVPLFLFCQDAGYAFTESNEANVWLFLYLGSLLAICVGSAYFYKLCLLVLKDRMIAFLGTILYIIWPANLIFLSPYYHLTPETLVAPILVWIFYITLSGKNRLVIFFAGIVLGYCILIRAYFVLFPVAFIFMAFIFAKRFDRMRILIVALTSLCVLLPWPMRNYIVFNDFSLSSQGGRHLLYGNNASARGSWDGTMWGKGIEVPEKYQVLKDLDAKYPGLLKMAGYTETEASRIFQQEAISWMKEHPAGLLWLCARKVGITFYPTNFENGNKINILTATMFLLFIPGLMLYGYRCVRKVESLELLLLALPILSLSFLLIIFFADYRVRYIMEPFIIIFSLYVFSPSSKSIEMKFR